MDVVQGVITEFRGLRLHLVHLYVAVDDELTVDIARVYVLVTFTLSPWGCLGKGFYLDYLGDDSASRHLQCVPAVSSASVFVSLMDDRADLTFPFLVSACMVVHT